MNKYCIYKHECLENHKVYIGQTCQNINRRWRDGEGYKHSPRFYSAILHYGWKNFTHEILEDNLTAEAANEREQYWIKYYDTYHNGYNQTMGGEGCNIDMPENIAKVIDDLKKSKLSFTEIAQNNGVSISLVSRINSGENWHDDELTYPIRDTSSKRKVCPICGGKKSKSSKICKNCRNKKT